MGRVVCFLGDENGQGFLEYGLLIVLLAVGSILVLTVFGEKVSGMFENISLHEAFTPKN